ncbi:phenylalanine--tRNA ligase beta subunit-related protein [Streptosporangium sp. NPDC006013]|uniref:B3/B4 domain-containing protein n=1 Tax=Streptosporangium sp. NPDC006013 TaxID=3155596 RepID=UPI0033B7E12B
MTAIHLTPAVAETFPDTLIAVVTATGRCGTQPWPAAMTDLEQRLAAGTWQPADENNPLIATWHTAYRSFGTNPRRIRPSVDALGRRLAKKGTLPRINPAVDTYNTVSVTHGLPAGTFDLDHITGDIHIRYADGTENFTPLGEPDTTECPCHSLTGSP